MTPLTPRTCPLCEYPFAPADGHQILVDEAELAKLTEGHDRRTRRRPPLVPAIHQRGDVMAPSDRFTWQADDIEWDEESR